MKLFDFIPSIKVDGIEVVYDFDGTIQDMFITQNNKTIKIDKRSFEESHTTLYAKIQNTINDSLELTTREEA